MKDQSLRAINTNLSYFTLRKLIGWLGLLLPWAVWAIAGSNENSISDYYYTVSGVLFTSVLTLVGAFLISYRGYDKADETLSDNVLTWIGGILILIVAAIPTPYDGGAGGCPTPICLVNDAWGWVHFGAAVLFFVTMGHMSAFHFTKGNKPFTAQKLKRNQIYRFCGYGMWVVLLITGILWILEDRIPIPRLIFWSEVILLVLFGTCWLVKGKGLVDLNIQHEEGEG
ncbi:MAG TPA: hypothetical protein VJ949_06605 [Cryomorphaceae bacterium]|nr:hypothetical protein [Cryomorphaceae bacterium]